MKEIDKTQIPKAISQIIPIDKIKLIQGFDPSYLKYSTQSLTNEK